MRKRTQEGLYDVRIIQKLGSRKGRWKRINLSQKEASKSDFFR
jgi:hypothetical protein